MTGCKDGWTNEVSVQKKVYIKAKSITILVGWYFD